MKKIMKRILSVILVIGVLAGSVYFVKEYIIEKTSPRVDTYKEKTKRNNKYNGVYTLTKLDEKGNNTWDGLICYVKDDKIVSGSILDFISFDDLKKEEFGKTDVDVSEDELDSLALGKITGLEYGSIGENSNVFFNSGSSIQDAKSGYLIAKMSFEAYKKDVDINDTKTYEALYKSGLLAGYDEKSKEVWLSKLVNNNKSNFNKDYELIHYSSSKDMEKNCELDNGFCIGELNRVFNAGL